MSQVHVGGISEHMKDDEIDHMSYTNTVERTCYR